MDTEFANGCRVGVGRPCSRNTIRGTQKSAREARLSLAMTWRQLLLPSGVPGHHRRRSQPCQRTATTSATTTSSNRVLTGTGGRWSPTSSELKPPASTRPWSDQVFPLLIGAYQPNAASTRFGFHSSPWSRLLLAGRCAAVGGRYRPARGRRDSILSRAIESLASHTVPGRPAD